VSDSGRHQLAFAYDPEDAIFVVQNRDFAGRLEGGDGEFAPSNCLGEFRTARCDEQSDG
jgi:hypothetical protein